MMHVREDYRLLPQLPWGVLQRHFLSFGIAGRVVISLALVLPLKFLFGASQPWKEADIDCTA